MASRIIDESEFNYREPNVDLEMFQRGMLRLPTVLRSLGYSGLRPGQDQIIYSVMGGVDTIAVASTAFGKTACMIIPALCFDYRLLIFCPLKSLMRDQVKNLQRQGIVALNISSDNSESENARNISDWVRGDCKILYIAPERLMNPMFMAAMRQAPPQIISIDECHCLSSWADNFRSSYTRIGDIIELYNPRVVLAMTATLDQETEADVRRVVRIPKAPKIRIKGIRHNLKLSSSSIDENNDLVGRVRDIEGSILVYAGTQKGSEETAVKLSRSLGEEVGFYHAGVPEKTKQMYQDSFYDGRTRVMCATNAFGMGIDKALPLYAKILTPTGWKKNGELKVGDWVIGKKGKKTKVVAVHDRGKLPSFRVKFSDDSEVVCADDHKWSVQSPKDRYAKRGFKTLPLSEIRAKLTDNAGNHLHFIPIVEPVEFRTGKPLLLDPYVVGVLLGNGCISQGGVKLVTPDSEMIELVSSLIPSGMKVVPYDEITYGLVLNRWVKNPIRKQLDALGLAGATSHTKFIPAEYLLASVGDRVSLLQGLMDTDGSVAKHDGVSLTYVTVSPQLKEDIMFLVRSLGGTVKPKWKICAWYLHIALPNSIRPFRTQRKLHKVVPRTKYFPRRCIVSVTKEKAVEMRCITVSNPDGLYVTEDFIVTHNSDIRGVIHTMHPTGPQALMQECGRGGRDGRDCICHTYASRRAIEMNEMFIRTGHPSKDQIDRFYDALVQKCDASGVAHLSYVEIEEISNVSQDYFLSISQILRGSRCIEEVDDAIRTHQVKFIKSPEAKKSKEVLKALEELAFVSDEGWSCFDIDVLASRVSLAPTTLRTYLNTWSKEKCLEYVPPPRGKPIKLIGGLDLVDYPRLAKKREAAYAGLAYVKGYFDVKDAHKHQYLEDYFASQED
jgi:superfamily II DNA helicase RecQ